MLEKLESVRKIQNSVRKILLEKSVRKIQTDLRISMDKLG